MLVTTDEVLTLRYFIGSVGQVGCRAVALGVSIDIHRGEDFSDLILERALPLFPQRYTQS